MIIKLVNPAAAEEADLYDRDKVGELFSCGSLVIKYMVFIWGGTNRIDFLYSYFALVISSVALNNI